MEKYSCEHNIEDPHVESCSVAMIQGENGQKRGGAAFTIICPVGFDSVEIILEYKELKALIEEIEEDMRCNPNLFENEGKR